MILPKQKESGVIKIDLSGPHGNAAYLLGIAKALGKHTDKDIDDIINRMQSGSYKNLVNVLDQEFGDLVILYEA